MAIVQNSTIDFVAQWEGFSNVAYWDYGQYSIGYGSGKMPNGRPVKAGDTITIAEARNLLRSMLQDYALTVNSTIYVPLNQNQFDALVSLCYNIGKSGFSGSSVARRVNANPNDFAGIEAAFKLWNKAGGAVLPGLVKRRQAEADLYKRSVAGSFFLS